MCNRGFNKEYEAKAMSEVNSWTTREQCKVYISSKPKYNAWMEPTNQPTNQPISQSNNQSINQSNGLFIHDL